MPFFVGSNLFKPPSIFLTHSFITLNHGSSSTALIQSFNIKLLPYDNNFGTSEEKELVRYFQLQVTKLQEKYNEIYLIRNERHFAIYSFDYGGRFEPDFVLFMKDKNNSKQINYQIFIEPKGNQFKDNNGGFKNSKESWKNKFLLEIENKFEIMELEFGKYKLIGLPFYNKDMEEEFNEDFKVLIK